MKTLVDVFRFATLSLSSLLVLSACGGGGGGGGGFVPATSTASPVVSQGVVTAKGSVFVNGIEFSTVGASITIDDSPNRPEIELKEGMTVKIRGTSDDATKKGTAIQIEGRDALEGQIQAIDNARHTITVMGQTVRVEDNITRLNDDNTIKTFAAAGFALNDHVEVHGSADDPAVGGIRATTGCQENYRRIRVQRFYYRPQRNIVRTEPDSGRCFGPDGQLLCRSAPDWSDKRLHGSGEVKCRTGSGSSHGLADQTGRQTWRNR